MADKIAYHNSITDVSTGIGTQADITVYEAGTTNLSTIYDDETGTPRSNPFATDIYGRFSFFADPDVYDIKASGVGITSYTLERVSIIRLSKPPSGYCEVTNIYVRPAGSKFTYDWDDVPEP